MHLICIEEAQSRRLYYSAQGSAGHKESDIFLGDFVIEHSLQNPQMW